MTAKEGYDVLRLIEHGQTCYISSEYVEGRILAGWLKARPDVTKEQLFSLIREIVNQLSMIHKCRKNPYYRYVNPYSIVVTDEGKPYFLDMEAGSNEKRMRFMQRRAVRECFLPKEDSYYQKGSTELDIYGTGKTIQYLLAVSRPSPPLSGREEKRFLRIISKCLKYQSKSSYQNVVDIRRNLPHYKQKKEHTQSVHRWLFMAAGAMVILAAAWRLQELVSFEEKEMEDLSPVTPEYTRQDSGDDRIYEESGDTEESSVRTEMLMRGSGEAYMDVAMAYILDLEDYEKSLYYLEKIQEYVPARDLKEVAEALLGTQKDPEILEESLIRLEEEAARDSTGQYYRCLVRGYALLDTRQSAEAILRIGKLCMGMLDGDDEESKEMREYMASAYERIGESEEAAQMYEEILHQEMDAAKRETVYGKIIALYEACGQKDMAMDICMQGMGELGDSKELKIAHIRLMCRDDSVGSDLCAQMIQEYIRQIPGIMETEEFQELAGEYGIQVEGDQVWVGI